MKIKVWVVWILLLVLLVPGCSQADDSSSNFSTTQTECFSTNQIGLSDENSTQEMTKSQSTVSTTTLTNAVSKTNTTAAKPSIPLKRIQLNKIKYNMIVGGTVNLTAIFEPSNAEVLWKSSNTKTATVNNGTVKAISPGTATITAYSEGGGVTSSCLIQVFKSEMVRSYPYSVGRVILNGATSFEYSEMSPVFDLPALSDLKKFPILKKLSYIYYTKIESGEFLEGLYNLEELTIGNPGENFIKSLPELPSLVSLSFGAVELVDFEDHHMNLSGINKFSTVQTLSTRHRILHSVKELTTLPNLQKLNIYGGYIYDMPEYEPDSLVWFTKLSSLKSLTFSYTTNANKLPSLRNLTKLEELNLNYCNIADLKFLDGLTRLRKLYINSNEITDISVISQMANLEVLNIAYNPIKNITPIYNLKKLKKLILHELDPYNTGDTVTQIKKYLPNCEVVYV